MSFTDCFLLELCYISVVFIPNDVLLLDLSSLPLSVDLSHWFFLLTSKRKMGNLFMNSVFNLQVKYFKRFNLAHAVMQSTPYT